MLPGRTSRVAALVGALFAVTPTPAAVGIENGRIAGAGEASFAVALVKRGDGADSVFCGGALVAADVVVTAAHCVVDPPSEGIDVVAGRRDLRARDGDRVAVATSRSLRATTAGPTPMTSRRCASRAPRSPGHPSRCRRRARWPGLEPPSTAGA